MRLWEPAAWDAITGTAGIGDGCDRPFWLRHEAAAYVAKHGGYIKPLYALPSEWHEQPETLNVVIRPPLALTHA